MSKKRSRRTTPAMQASDGLALIGESLTISKSDAIHAVRNVADVLGLNQKDLTLLDVLCSLSPLQDWQSGSRALVWPDNQQLKDLTGLTIPALKSCLTHLNDAGLLAYKDSANGKRWGKRDDNGTIIEAYGFDLSPMAARTPELEWLYEAREFERAGEDDSSNGAATEQLTQLIDIMTRKLPTSALSAMSVRVQSIMCAFAPQKIITGSLSTMFNSFFGFWMAVPSESQLEQPLSNTIANFDTHEDQDVFDFKAQPIVKLRFAANRKNGSAKTPVRVHSNYSAAQRAVLMRTERKSWLKYQTTVPALAGVTKGMHSNMISACGLKRPVKTKASSGLVPANALSEVYWCNDLSLHTPFLLPLSNQIQVCSTRESHGRPSGSLDYIVPGTYRRR